MRLLWAGSATQLSGTTAKLAFVDELDCIRGPTRQPEQNCDVCLRSDLDQKIRARVQRDREIARNIIHLAEIALAEASREYDLQCAVEACGKKMAAWIEDGGMSWLTGEKLDPSRVHFSFKKH